MHWLSSPRPRPLTAVALVLLALTLTGCAINPATGRRQLVLLSEQQEVAIGAENDQQLVQQLGLYPDESLQQYVAGLGRELAAASERPHLDWQFRVVDDPVVNAFALPGGFVYITRGILAHFNDEAELASVLGHEIGHVTARHSVSQMTKSQIAQLGMLGGMIAAPELMQQYGGLAQQVAGLAFLKFSRDDERQADDLGLRYMVGSGYDPRPMPNVFETLRRVSATSGGERMPGWMSTHPLPENRRDRIEAQIAELGVDLSNRPTNRDRFLDAIDGITFDADPRQGYFRGSEFVHPEMAFQLRFPEGWTMVNQTSAVLAVSPEQDAMVQMTMVQAAGAAEARDTFFTQEGVSRADVSLAAGGGLRSAGAGFVAQAEQGAVQGLVLWVEFDGRIFQLLGYTPQARWADRRGALESTLRSFDRLQDRRVLEAKAKTLEVVRAPRSMTIEEFASRYEASIEPERLALLNGLEPGDRLESGRRYKIVTGGYQP